LTNCGILEVLNSKSEKKETNINLSAEETQIEKQIRMQACAPEGGPLGMQRPPAELAHPVVACWAYSTYRVVLLVFAASQQQACRACRRRRSLQQASTATRYEYIHVVARKASVNTNSFFQKMGPILHVANDWRRRILPAFQFQRLERSVLASDRSPEKCPLEHVDHK
jgi:hypothetical protein